MNRRTAGRPELTGRDTVSFEALPDDMQELIGSLFEDRELDASGLALPLRRIPTEAFPEIELADGALDARGAEYALDMTSDIAALPPIIVNGEVWMDGRHRVWAHKHRSEPSILAIDLSGLLPPPALGECCHIATLQRPKSIDDLIEAEVNIPEWPAINDPKWPSHLVDRFEIASYIVRNTPDQNADEEFIEENYRDCQAVLRLVPIGDLFEGDPDRNLRGEARERAYAKLHVSTMPPLFVEESGEVSDGNHRLRVARRRGDTHLLCYVIEPQEEDVEEEKELRGSSSLLRLQRG